MAQNFFEQALPQFVKMRQREKYISLIAQTTYVPKWMVEKTNADLSQIAKVAFVKIPYQIIPDSTVKISDAEIQSYLDDHKSQFNQEESRAITYVSFSAAPTAADSLAIYQAVDALKTEFTNTADMESFLARNGTEVNYLQLYVPASKITGSKKDSILTSSKGAVIGPYLDGTNFVIAKIMDVKTLPDSVHARHILIAFNDPKTKQPKIDDSAAKKKIDSIRVLVEQGQSFDSLAIRFSDDPGSSAKGGDLGTFEPSLMVKEFRDYAYNGKKGEYGIVKTQFGYHLIQILDQSKYEPAYNVAYFARRIEPSQETDQNASGLASQFAGENRDKAAFEAGVKKGNLRSLTAPEMAAADFTVQGLGSSRSLVRWVYGAKLGEVSESFSIGDKYVVGMVTDINHKGTMSVAKSKAMIEPILRNQIKAERIFAKIGTPASLEAVVASTGMQIITVDSIQFASPYIPNLGAEPKVVGYSFDKQIAGKPASLPVGGSEGVYVLKVENVSARANYGSDVEQSRQTILQAQESIIQRSGVDALKKKAKIEDNRGKFL